MMKQRQRGLSLIVVALLMAGLAAAAMAVLFSMRQERNLFAEGADKLMKKSGAEAVARPAAPAGGVLKRCVIDGKTVFSDTECGANHASTRTVKVHETRGIDAPKAPKPAAPGEGAEPSLREKMIDQSVERATR